MPQQKNWVKEHSDITKVYGSPIVHAAQMCKGKWWKSSDLKRCKRFP